MKENKRLSEKFPEESEVDKINEYLLIEQTELAPADLGFVFGNRRFSDPLIEKAAELYHKGYFKKLVVTGGVKDDRGVLEAHCLRDGLIKKGVPESAILVEDKSTNTRENIENARALVAREMGKDAVKTVIGIGQLYAARRYLMTLKYCWPEVFAMHASVNGFPVEKKDWIKNKSFRVTVLAEWRKQTIYPGKDFIVEVDIDEINRKAIQLREEQKPARPGQQNPYFSP